MKNFLFKSLKFTAFATVFFVLINVIYFVVVVKNSVVVRNRMESLKFNNPDFDLLAVGASTAFDAFDAELLTSNGIKSYNLAMGGSTVKTSYIQLNEYLDQYETKPSYVLLGLNGPLVKTFDEESIHPIIEVTMKGHKYKIDDVPILKFKWLGFEFLKGIVSENHRKARLSLGQLKFQKTIPDQSNCREQYLDFHEYESSIWIGKVAEFCDENEIELFIIEMPGYKETQNQSETGLHTISLVNGYTANLYNLNSNDFCNIFDSNSDWIGNSHLNEYGAIKFTNEIIRLLKEQDKQL